MDILTHLAFKKIVLMLNCMSYIYMCVCVCVCVRARARLCVYVRYSQVN